MIKCQSKYLKKTFIGRNIITRFFVIKLNSTLPTSELCFRNACLYHYKIKSKAVQRHIKYVGSVNDVKN